MTADDDWTRHGRVLVVTAHPDDPEFHFGATVAKLVGSGAEVFYAICSDGSRGVADTRPSDLEVAALRAREQREAAAVLGVREVAFLGLPDGGLTPGPALRGAIARQIRRYRPSLVLTHFPRRVLNLPVEASHPDHVAVGEAALDAATLDAGSPRAFPEMLGEGLEPHRVAEVWLPGYERPDLFVDATAFMDKKVEAILCHRSQLGDGDPAEPPAWVGEWMRGVGAGCGYEYAEHFRRITL